MKDVVDAGNVYGGGCAWFVMCDSSSVHATRNGNDVVGGCCAQYNGVLHVCNGDARSNVQHYTPVCGTTNRKSDTEIHNLEIIAEAICVRRDVIEIKSPSGENRATQVHCIV